MNPKARSIGLLCEEAQEGWSSMTRSKNGRIRLNRSAALVWKLCDGRKSVADIAAPAPGFVEPAGR